MSDSTNKLWKCLKTNPYYLQVQRITLLILVGALLPILQVSAYGGLMVIDKDTGKPVEGAFLIRTWYITIPNVAGGNNHFSDVGISISDENGEFFQPLNNYFHLYIPLLYHQYENMSCIYKPGYEIGGFSKKDKIIELEKIPTIFQQREEAIISLGFTVDNFIKRQNGGNLIPNLGWSYLLETGHIRRLCEVIEKEREFARLPSYKMMCISDNGSIPAVVIPSVIMNKKPLNESKTEAGEKYIEHCSISERSINNLISAYHNAIDDKTRVCILRKLADSSAPDAVDPIISILKSNIKNYEIRREAEEALIALKPHSEEAIIELFSENPDTFRHIAKTALEGTRPVNKIPALINLLGNDSLRIQGIVIKLLAGMNPEAVDPLIRTVQSENPKARKAAAETLGKIGNRRAISTLSELLADSDIDCRIAASKALMNFKNVDQRKALFVAYQKETDPEAKRLIGITMFENLRWTGKPYLEIYLKHGSLSEDQYAIELDAEARKRASEELTDSSVEEKKKIMNALSWIGSDWSVDQVTAMINHPNKSVQIDAVSALGCCQNEKAICFLVALLKDENYLLREEAVYSLARVRSFSTIQNLIMVLQDESPVVRKAAAASLTNFGEAAIDPLTKLLSSDDVYLRWRAAWILGHLKDPNIANGASREMVIVNHRMIDNDRAVRALIRSLNDEAPEVRWAAAYSLGYIKKDKAIKPLQRLLGDSDAGIRTQASESLALINGFYDKDDILQKGNFIPAD